MEHCEGGDLTKLIKKCKQGNDYVAEDVIWKIFTQIVLALNECHNRKEGKILHRDLKPGNVFFDKANNVKLGDFGLSKILSTTSQYACTNVGTPYYMSPEQISESSYNEKSDIWSAGCLLFEMVSLRPPFQASNYFALAKNIMEKEIDRIPEKYSEILQTLIVQMLQKDPNKRPSVDDIMHNPKISQRIEERKVRDWYSNIKLKDESLSQKLASLKQKEYDLNTKDQELKEREKQIQEMKLKMS
jgi:serine/threonine protein kinase